jgi:hypothetical protein
VATSRNTLPLEVSQQIAPQKKNQLILKFLTVDGLQSKRAVHTVVDPRISGINSSTHLLQKSQTRERLNPTAVDPRIADHQLDHSRTAPSKTHTAVDPRISGINISTPILQKKSSQ